MTGGERAVFFDKDGTLVENVPYNVDTSAIRFSPGAATCLRLLHQEGFRLFVVSNQSGVARGFHTEEALGPVARKLTHMCLEAGVPLDGFYYCPHHPEGTVGRYAKICACRKPAPGLVTRAAGEHGIDLTSSWLVGDILDDVEAGRRAGCRTILINNGGETEWQLSEERMPDFLAGDLVEAALFILARRREGR